MKKMTKRVASFFLALALILTTVLAMPASADAATKSKSKKATLKVTDTKISGFKTISGTLTFNSKYVIAFGKDGAGNNVYSTSTNGKTFTKAKKLGLTGTVSYQSVGKKLYVFDENDDGYVENYKCVTNPTKLASTSAVSLASKITVPNGLSLRVYSYGFGVASSGKLYLEASYSGYPSSDSYEYLANSYILILNGTNVTVTDLCKAISKASGKTVENRTYYPDYNYYSSTYQAIIVDSEYNYNESSSGYNHNVYMTTNGTSFTALPSLPDTSNSYYSFTWLGKKLFAFRTNSHSDTDYTTTYGLPSNSKNYGTYYMYNSSSKKWVEYSTKKASSVGFAYGYPGEDIPYSYYYDYTSEKQILTLRYMHKNASQVLYSTNGTTWRTLPKLGYHSTATKKSYTLNNTEFYKTTSGTYATQDYDTGTNKRFYALYKLSGSTWKVIKTFLISGVKRTSEDGYEYTSYPFSESYYSTVPSAIYASGSASYGCNLKTKKVYKLPFSYLYNNIVGGDVKVYYDANKLYVTRDTYKTVTTVTLKAGSKTLKNMTSRSYGYTKNQTYYYFIYGNKMYYATYTSISSIK